MEREASSQAVVQDRQASSQVLQVKQTSSQAILQDKSGASQVSVKEKPTGVHPTFREQSADSITTERKLQSTTQTDKKSSSRLAKKESHVVVKDTDDKGGLEPVEEVNEAAALAHEEFGDRPVEWEEFEEIPPKIYSVKDIEEPMTLETLNNAFYEVGVINLCWPEINEPVFETRTCFPESYYTNSKKERLLLAYAESFRRQFHLHFNKDPCYRKPLLLQAPNECGLQKMVCTTIRPTKLCYTGTNTWQGLASLVGDYFVYEPLAKPLLHVST